MVASCNDGDYHCDDDEDEHDDDDDDVVDVDNGDEW